MTQSKEKAPLRISMIGTLFMAALGFFFAVYTSSQAILLDGILSLVNFVVVILSMKVVNKVIAPSTTRFPFGFLQLEPLFNFFRGFLFLGVLAFASFSAVTVILEGGSEMVFGVAVIYALIATLGCFGVYFVIKYYHKKYPTSILDLEMKGWLLDGILSSVVLLTFLIGFFIQGTSFEFLLPYLDSVIVIIISAIMLPVPFKILRENVFELLLSSPPEEVAKEVSQLVEGVMEKQPIDKFELKVTKTGRVLYVYILLLSDQKTAKIDKLRVEIEKHLNSKSFPASVLIEQTLDQGFYEEVKQLYPQNQLEKVT